MGAAEELDEEYYVLGRLACAPHVSCDVLYKHEVIRFALCLRLACIVEACSYRWLLSFVRR